MQVKKKVIPGKLVSIYNANNNFFKPFQGRKPERKTLGNVGVNETLGNERERARKRNEFFAWEFSEEDIKRISILKWSLNKDRSEVLDQMPVYARYVLYVIEKLDEDK